MSKNPENSQSKQLKIALLTTETPHHVYFASRLTELGQKLSIISETDSPSFTYSTAHAFEKERDDYERQHWFKSRDLRLSSFGPCLEVENINCKVTSDFLNENACDLFICFGTRKICLNSLPQLKKNTFNLHGADPEVYRGLDSQLWALWHKDFDELKTCLHQLNDKLDDGDIFNILPINRAHISKLEDVRILNTENCVALVLDLISKISIGQKLSLKKQSKKGKYYSAMPSVLKDVLVKRSISKRLAQ